ncbi:MAG TPA: alpha/beta hydrolase [Methylomirabilota bacterium]|nr:alpha/beta hydrolase [Methylomirabilota bacterium]
MLAGIANAAPASVAYRRIELRDPLGGEAFPVALWYPTAATPAHLYLTDSLTPCRWPALLCRQLAFDVLAAPDAAPADGRFGLIVISHGGGGLALNHRDLASALAARGYVVAAPNHPRGAGNDISGVGVWVGRPQQVSRVIDALFGDAALGPRIDRARVGVVGHSNGGYTALALAGARPDVREPERHCRQHPDDAAFCTYGGAAARESIRTLGEIPDLADRRVRAVVLMAPNAVAFPDEALARVAVPVRLYGAGRDTLTLVRYHAARLAGALPPGTEYVLLERAGHFSFITRFPWTLGWLVGDAARDPAGLDRDALHAVINLEIVDFFDRTLRPAR